MNAHRQFITGIVVIGLIAVVLFGLEFWWEWQSAGLPGPDATSWSGVNNAKMVDMLSPIARAYNNILAILLATIGLAIPLTANMHTPKLIEMFLRDRVNIVMLLLGAFGAAHALWVMSAIGPQFVPLMAWRVAVYGSLAGWIILVPYFFYVVRFLDPSNILHRLENNNLALLRKIRQGGNSLPAARAEFREGASQIATIIMKSIDRGDRGVTVEGTRHLKLLLEHYATAKPLMPAAWFAVDRDDCIGLSDEAIQLIVEDHTWVEHRVLTLLFIAYQSALVKMPDVISSYTDIVRAIALAALRHDDDASLELTIKFFNNFLREAINQKRIHAVYDLFYQYRLLAGDLGERPSIQEKIGRHFLYYSDLAVNSGLSFVPMFVASDLGWVVSRAYGQRSEAADDLLQDLLSLDHQLHSDPRFLVVKAKVIVGANLLEHGFEDAARRVGANLAGVSEASLAEIENDLVVRAERSFWEVTDRQVSFDWVPPEQRPFIKQFLQSCVCETCEPLQE